MHQDTIEIFNYLTDLERAAEDLLTDKQEVIDLDRKRNYNREALRHLMKTNDRKTWMAMGGSFFKLEVSDAKDLLQKKQSNLDEEINKIRNGMKGKMNKIRDLEGKEELKGFNLKPLDQDELQAMLKAKGN